MDIRNKIVKIANNILADINFSTQKEFEEYIKNHPNYREDTKFFVDGMQVTAPPREKSRGKKEKIQMTDEQKKLHQMAIKGNEYEKEEAALSEETHPYTLHLLSLEEDYNIKSLVSSNPKASTKTLLNLIDSLNKDDRENLAFYTLAPEVLHKLSDDEDTSVRECVAENESTSQETLEKLSDDEDTSIRECVAGNKNTSQETLEKLAKDENYDIRKAVSERPDLSAEVLHKLSDDEAYDIRETVAKNPNTSSSSLEEIVTKKMDANIVSILMNHPNFNEKVFFWMIDSYSTEHNFVEEDGEKIAKMLVSYADDHGGHYYWFDDYYRDGRLVRYEWIYEDTVKIDNKGDPIWEELAEREDYWTYHDDEYY